MVCRPVEKPQLLEATLVGLQALHSHYGSGSKQARPPPPPTHSGTFLLALPSTVGVVIQELGSF